MVSELLHSPLSITRHNIFMGVTYKSKIMLKSIMIMDLFDPPPHGHHVHLHLISPPGLRKIIRSNVDPLALVIRVSNSAKKKTPSKTYINWNASPLDISIKSVLVTKLEELCRGHEVPGELLKENVWLTVVVEPESISHSQFALVLLMGTIGLSCTCRPVVENNLKII